MTSKRSHDKYIKLLFYVMMILESQKAYRRMLTKAHRLHIFTKNPYILENIFIYRMKESNSIIYEISVDNKFHPI